jgi:hypothetical protein
MDSRKSFESKHPKVLGRKRKRTREQEMLKALEQKLPDSQLLQLASDLSTDDMLRLARANTRLYSLFSKPESIRFIARSKSHVPDHDALCSVAFSEGARCPDPWNPTLSFLKNDLSVCKGYCEKLGLLMRLKRFGDAILRSEGSVLDAFVIHGKDVWKFNTILADDIPAYQIFAGDGKNNHVAYTKRNDMDDQWGAAFQRVHQDPFISALYLVLYPTLLIDLARDEKLRIFNPERRNESFVFILAPENRLCYPDDPLRFG